MKKLTRVPFFGAFSQEIRELITTAVRREGPDAVVIHLCSGSWDFGITLDKRIYDGFPPPKMIADVQALPFKDEAGDVIILDPPFSKKFKPMYKGAYYANRRQVFKKVLRVLKPGGLLIFSHYFVPQFRILQLEDIYMIHNRPWEHVRALSFSRKKATLTPIYEPEKTDLEICGSRSILKEGD